MDCPLSQRLQAVRNPFGFVKWLRKAHRSRALVENGVLIELDVAKRKLQLLVSEEELSLRKKSWKKPEPPLERGYWRLYFDHVLQAHEGADLDFLVGKSGAFVPRDNH